MMFDCQAQVVAKPLRHEHWLSPPSPSPSLVLSTGCANTREAKKPILQVASAESRVLPFQPMSAPDATLQVTAMSRTLSVASHAALAASDAVAMTAAAYDLAFRPAQPARRPQGSLARQRSPPRRGRGQVPVVALPQHSMGQEREQEAGLERSPEELQQDRLAGILQAGLHQLHGRVGLLRGLHRSCWTSCLHPACKLQLGQASWDAASAASPIIGLCPASVD